MRLNYESQIIVNQSKLIKKWNGFAKQNDLPFLREEGICVGLSYVFAQYSHHGKKEKFMELLHKASSVNTENLDEETKKFIKRVIKTHNAQGYSPKKNELNKLKEIDKHSIIVSSSEDIYQLISPLKQEQSTILSFLKHVIYVEKLDGKITVYNSNNDEIRSFEDDYTASRFILENITNTKKKGFFEELSDFFQNVFAPGIKQDYLSAPVIANSTILAPESSQDKNFEGTKNLYFDRNDSTNKALVMHAIREFDNELIEKLFGQFNYSQYDIDCKWETQQQQSGKFTKEHSPLTMALACGNIEAAKFFIAQGADPNALLDFASRNMEYLDLTLELIPNALNLLNSQGGTILHDAILFDHPQMVKELLELGANYSDAQIEKTQTQEGAYRDLNGLTPLELATIVERKEIIKMINDFHHEKIKDPNEVVENSNLFSSTYSFCTSSHPTNEKLLKIEQDQENDKNVSKKGLDNLFEEEKTSIDDLNMPEKTQEELLNRPYFNLKI